MGLAALFTLVIELTHPHEGEAINLWWDDEAGWCVSVVAMGHTLTGCHRYDLGEALRALHEAVADDYRQRINASLPTADDVRGILAEENSGLAHPGSQEGEGA